MSTVYGPVPSWRLGRSLGTDPVSTRPKTCSFDCIYCQLGRTKHPLSQRRCFVEPEVLRSDLQKAMALEVDYVTFSGVAEPTLAANLADLLAVVREILPGVPTAIFTNSSLTPVPEVRRDLARFDVVAAKLDAPNQRLFEQINRPFVDRTLEDVVAGVAQLREESPSKLALQMMFIELNRAMAPKMAELARALRPDEVQLNTPLRPCPVRPLTPEEMKEVKTAFQGLDAICVYDRERPQVAPLDAAETRMRRPESRSEAASQ
jgi:wyosine [tRNA(Phe)-imidazoG37] synthetase (radical SAM superfamily)